MKRSLLFVQLMLILSCSYSQWVDTYTFSHEYGIYRTLTSFSDLKNGWAITTVDISPSSGSLYEVFKSEDYGNSWQKYGGGGGDFVYITDLVSPSKDTVYYLRLNTGTFLYYSYNNGNTWDNTRLDFGYPEDLYSLNSRIVYMTIGGTHENSQLFKLANDSVY